jgi:GntR family transcriptional regulator, transcriptional repressor for pyruvate dehydrogenase complex
MKPKHRSRNSLVDHVVRELREMIISRKYLPGAFLPPQKSLAAQFEVGLSTIHEAMQVLSALGLIESHPGKGTWVRRDATSALLHPEAVKTRLGELNARHLYEARSVIEVGLIKLAAQRATDQDIEQITAAMRALDSAQGDEAFVEADIDYHLAVARAGHNELLEQFYHVARELLAEVASELIALPAVKEESLPLQAAVAKAIEQHQVQKAEKAALAHMQYIDSLLKQYS